MTQKNILIVDDDERLRELLKDYLTEKKLNVYISDDFENARDIMQYFIFDLVILDRMMPSGDGIKLVSIIKDIYPTPVIMLTALGENINKIEGLKIGADDYVSKPFSMPELLARIKAVIRRNKIVSDNLRSISKKQFTHLDVYFDLDKRLISVEGQEKFFRPKEFDLAYLLMSNPGVVFTREKLVQKIWDFEYFGDTRTVDVHIRWIREKIENNNSKPKKILTVRGVGYKANVE